MHLFPSVLCISCLLETNFRTLHYMYEDVVFTLHHLHLSCFNLRILISVIFAVLWFQSSFFYGFNRVFMLSTCSLCKIQLFDDLRFCFCMPLQNGLWNINCKNFVRSPFGNFTDMQHGLRKHQEKDITKCNDTKSAGHC